MKLRAFALGICLLFAFTSCQNPASSDTPVTPTPETPTTPATQTVRFAGYYDDSDIDRPCYWEGGTRHGFGPALTGRAQAYNPVVSSGDTVYAAGYYRDGALSRPCYWKGAEAVTLINAGNADFTHQAYAFSLALAGNTVYVAGIYRDDTMRDDTIREVHCYWEDGTFHSLEDSVPAGDQMPDPEDTFLS